MSHQPHETLPTGVRIGQIALVCAIVTLALWGATQWTAHALGYSQRLGAQWFESFGIPIYRFQAAG